MSDQVSEQDKPEGAISEENLVNAQEVIPEQEDDETEAEESGDDEDADLETTGENSIEEVAKAVLRGDWGEGQDQRLRLSEAGYDHKEVQAEVTRLRNHL